MRATSTSRQGTVFAVLAAFSLVLPFGAARGDEPASTEIASGDVSIVEFIDQNIRQGWEDNEITPSAQATDEEWVRRIHLDVVGRIPTLTEVKSFLKD